MSEPTTLRLPEIPVNDSSSTNNTGSVDVTIEAEYEIEYVPTTIEIGGEEIETMRMRRRLIGFRT